MGCSGVGRTPHQVLHHPETQSCVCLTTDRANVSWIEIFSMATLQLVRCWTLSALTVRCVHHTECTAGEAQQARAAQSLCSQGAGYCMLMR